MQPLGSSLLLGTGTPKTGSTELKSKISTELNTSRRPFGSWADVVRDTSNPSPAPSLFLSSNTSLKRTPEEESLIKAGFSAGQARDAMSILIQVEVPQPDAEPRPEPGKCTCRPTETLRANENVHCSKCRLIRMCLLRKWVVAHPSEPSTYCILAQHHDAFWKKTQACSCWAQFVVTERGNYLVWVRKCHTMRETVRLVDGNNFDFWRKMNRSFVPELAEKVYIKGEDLGPRSGQLSDLLKRMSINSGANSQQSNPFSLPKLVYDPLKQRPQWTKNTKRYRPSKNSRLRKLRRQENTASGPSNSARQDCWDAEQGEVQEIFDVLEAGSYVRYTNPPDETSRHLGDHSIAGEGSEPFYMRVPEILKATPNILKWANDCLSISDAGVVFDGASKLVTSEVITNAPSGEGRSKTFDATFLVNAIVRPDTFSINWSNGRKMDELPESSVETFRIGNQFDYQKLWRVFPPGGCVSLDVARLICEELPRNLQRNDNTGLYTKLWLAWFLHCDAERTDVKLEAPSAPADDLTYRNVHTTGAEAVGVAEAIVLDMLNGCFVVMWDDLTPADLKVLNYVAAEFPRVEQADAFLVLNSYSVPATPFRVYGKGTHTIPHGTVSSDEILAFIRKFTDPRDEWGECYQGFFRASLFATPYLWRRDFPNPDDKDKIITKVVMIQPTMEVGACTMPKPFDWNWMWRYFALSRSSKPGQAPVSEKNILVSKDGSLLGRIGFLCCCAWWLSQSSVLEALQIDGTDLSPLMRGTSLSLI